MPFPTKICAVCEEEFELKPDHPGYANKCRDCNAPQTEAPAAKEKMDADEARSKREADAERRRVIKEMLYTRK